MFVSSTSTLTLPLSIFSSFSFTGLTPVEDDGLVPSACEGFTLVKSGLGTVFGPNGFTNCSDFLAKTAVFFIGAWLIELFCVSSLTTPTPCCSCALFGSCNLVIGDCGVAGSGGNTPLPILLLFGLLVIWSLLLVWTLGI